jgi:hypothetical protein
LQDAQPTPHFGQVTHCQEDKCAATAIALPTIIRDLLQQADPLRHEPHWPAHERDRRRQAVVAAASHVTTPDGVWFRPRIVILAILTVALVTTFVLGSHKWSQGAVDLQAAVRFEVRLAEDSPAAGLQEAKILRSDRTVYLHREVIVTNSDIVQAQLIEGQGTSAYSVGVEFTASGVQKMRAATASHLNKPLAILIDGEVVMAPTLRGPISASALITGDYTKAEAERIVNGIGVR